MPSGLILLMPFAALTAGGVDEFFYDRIAPVLQERCIRCHNPDKPRGGLSLTSRAALLVGGESGAAINVGHGIKSLLIESVAGAKPKMPRQGAPLSSVQVQDFQEWIDAGAQWPAGVVLKQSNPIPSGETIWWSLSPLKRPNVPKIVNPERARTPVDAFLLAALDARKLHFSPLADRATLLRRVTFDVTGLPPTPAEVESFVRDADPNAYEKVVDRLLASPHYGERWGRHWLDVVHYGDSHGYDKDYRRDHAWRYRDYVIRCFNQDKPYARFIKEQIAGDVLFPNDPDGMLGTGFIAAGPWDFVGQTELREGSVEKEKTRLLDRDDMVANTISTFLSLTAHCARCHDHKFDPIPQKEYYRLQATFAGVERGDRPCPDPVTLEPRRGMERRRRQATAERDSLRKLISSKSNPELVSIDRRIKALRAQLAALPPAFAARASSTNGYHSAIEPTAEVVKWVQVDLGKSTAVGLIRLLPARPVDFRDTPGFGFPPRFRVDVSRDPTFGDRETVLDQTQADFPNPGDEPITIVASGKSARYVRVTATKLWRRTDDYVFALAELQVESNGVNIALGASVTALDSIEAGRWSKKFVVDDCDSRKSLPDLTAPAVRESEKARRVLEVQLQTAMSARRTAADRLIDPATRETLRWTEAEIAAADAGLKSLDAANLVYAVVPRPPRAIHRLHRGEVEQPRELVSAGALTAVSTLDADFHLAAATGEGARRIALAEWIADPRNPLTWRSIANRIWHYHFGRGLVETPNDFGRNGGRPTHPELLDWLAVEFRDDGGSFKKLQRTLLLSAAYQQATTNDAAAAGIDADNRYLWRMNRTRLDAEEVRDAVLAVSGKLDFKAGGPGYELFRYRFDFSPEYDHTALEKIHDASTYRRTVYRFIVRSVPNPFLESLDCADPNVNVPVRTTTLTALQALSLLNDPFMVRQAEYFAARLTAESRSLDQQIVNAYLLAFGRPPREVEKNALGLFVRKHGLPAACRLLLNANEFVFVD